MSDRQFKDCDGDTWTEFEPGMLRLTERVGGNTMFVGTEDSIEVVQSMHRPLTEIRPDVDIRALLAGVLEDMAEDVRREYWSATDPTSERVWERLGDVLSGKARELREESE